VVSCGLIMDAKTQAQFVRMWQEGILLSDIAEQLNCSWHSLAKERMKLGLPKRYGNYEDDGEIPPPSVIKLRCQAQQTNWTDTERRLRWRGPPHTIYESASTCDCQP